MAWLLSMKDKIFKYLLDNCSTTKVLSSVTLHGILRELSEADKYLLTNSILGFAKEYLLEFLNPHNLWNLKSGYSPDELLEVFVASETFLAPPEPDPLMSVPLWLIKEKCGWGRWCEVVGGNEWMLNEYLVAPNQTFDATKSQLSKLGII